MIINLSKIDFGGVATGGKSKPEETFDVQPTTADQTITPTEGSVFSGGTVRAVTSSIDRNIQPENIKEGVSILGVAGTLEEGITPAGTIAINLNGTYDVTNYASAEVNVGDTPDYRYMNGTVDRAGLKAIGWTDEDILTYEQNIPPHYPWQNDQYKVSDENKALYLLDDPNPESYKDNPNITYVPKKNMESYFNATYGPGPMEYIKGIPFYDTSNMTDMSGRFINWYSLITIPQLDTSNVTNIREIFRTCRSLTSIPQLNTSKVTDMYCMFDQCSMLTSIPQLDTSNVTNMGMMFDDCASLTNIPQLDTSNVTDMSQMFSGCVKLTSIPQLNTSNVTNMRGMFDGCINLTSIPLLDTSKVTDMYRMFNQCSKLTSIPQLGTSNVTNMNYTFADCTSLATIPLLDTSNVTNMDQLFQSSSGLTSIPQLNTSKVTSMYQMFWNCSKLTSIPQLDTSKVTNMMYMLYGCSDLTTVEGIDFSGLTSNLTGLFGWTSNMPKITRFIVNGKINVSISDNNSIKALTAIDYDSVKSILAAADRTDNTNAKELAFKRTMTDQNGELAALVSSCTSKGWTISGLTLQ